MNDLKLTFPSMPPMGERGAVVSKVENHLLSKFGNAATSLKGFTTSGDSAIINIGISDSSRSLPDKIKNELNELVKENKWDAEVTFG